MLLKKEVKVVTMMIPMLTLIMFLGATTQSFAMTNQELEALMNSASEVKVEMQVSGPYASMPSQTVGAASTVKRAFFSDIKAEDWFRDSVERASAAGYIKGYEDNTFRASNKITVGQFITVVTRIIKPDVEARTSGEFWYTKYVECARELGIVGKTENINAEKNALREEMAVLTARALGIKPSESVQLVFGDVPYNAETTKAIEALYSNYLIDGNGYNSKGEKTFGFGQEANRAELATISLRIENFKYNKEMFIQQRKIERAKAEEAYKAEQEQANKYIEVNGYKLPKNPSFNILYDSRGMQDVGGIPFAGNVTIRDKSTFEDMHKILTCKHSETIVKQALDYARTREKISLREELPYKEFKENGYTIAVYGPGAFTNVHISVFAR